MYRYTAFDRHFVHQRAAQYRDQLERHLKGQLSGDEFRPLRLQNGWYVQRHAPMLRVAVPYGELSSPQLRQLAKIARESGLARESLYKALSPEGNPEFATVVKVMRSLGLEFHASVAAKN